MNFKDRLKKMQAGVAEMMKDYTPGGPKYEAIPDGDYSVSVQATLDMARANPQKGLGERLMVVWKHVVMEGDSEGTQVFDRTVIEENKVGAQICRSRVEMLGYDWPEKNLGSLEDILNEVNEKAPVVVIRCKSVPQKNNPKYTNTRVNWLELPGASAETAGDETPGESAETAGDETPGESAETDLTLQKVLDFCAAHDISGVSTDNTVEEIVEALKESDETKWPADELTDDEKELLKETGLESCIVKPKPPTVKARPVIGKGKKK